MTHPKIILITDPRWSLERTVEVIEKAAAALAPGELMVQLRDKTSLFPIAMKNARRLREVSKNAGALFAMNLICKDMKRLLDLGEELAVDGFHVPSDLPAVSAVRAVAPWISVPAHTDADAQNATLVFASAMLVSPIFPSPGKGAPRGVAALGTAAAIQKARVYALGGVSPRTSAMCASAGADGVAVIRSLLDAEDPGETARQLAAPFREAV